jgi:hypothetical protein
MAVYGLLGSKVNNCKVTFSNQRQEIQTLSTDLFTLDFGNTKALCE